MSWIKRTRDTHFRDVTQLVTGHVSGRVLLRRRRSEVTVILDDLVVTASGTLTLIRLSTGFRPLHTTRQAWWRPSASGNETGGTVNVSTTGYFVGYQMVPEQPMTARIQFDSLEQFPTAWPGIEVDL